MKKIILFTDSLGAGGAQRQLVGLALMLKEKNYSVKVVTYHNLSFYKKILDDNNIQNEVLFSASIIYKRIFVIFRYLKKENPDWVIAYQEVPSLISCMIKRMGLNYKLLVSERNTTQYISFKDKVRFLLYKVADSIVPNSYSQEKFLLEHYPWMSSKIKTITNFVDLDSFVPINKTARSSIAKFLVVGSIAYSKNTRGVIEACKILKDKKLKFKLSWYGWLDKPTAYMLEMKNLVSALDLSDCFEFKEKSLDIIQIYQNSEYYCMPSFFEGTPNVLCEAISCGLPVISSKVCDNSIYAQENRNAYLFNPYSSEEIANAMIKMMNLTDCEYLAFSLNSRKIAIQYLSKTKFINKYLKIIEQ